MQAPPVMMRRYYGRHMPQLIKNISDRIAGNTVNESGNANASDPGSGSNASVAEIGPAGPAGLSCKICGKSYRGSSGLNVHMQFHTGKFSHWCAQCQKPFTCKGNYDYHMAKHEGRDFPCDRCTKRFQSKQNLHRHQRKDHGMMRT